MVHFGYLITSSLFGIFTTVPSFVAARFCEGGHICSLPRECCTQGCCPPYQSGPRPLPPATDHVLNLFFINHWYFWCLVVAILLAILCAYSLWKKRRQLCGWGTSDHHTQSEGDSAGSCYAPPQYSRCNSFHHPPPPYTEVTSKPDLYPLVFTCNGDNGKNGASYLMVQYFRNYIVRPAGSLSATSTVDSLSSSFICTANEANTLVPPTYSRAASPDIAINPQFQQHFVIPRSASQLVYSQDTNHIRITPTNIAYNNNNNSNNNNININNNNNCISNNNNNNNNNNNINNTINNQQRQQQQFPQSHLHTSESVNFQNIQGSVNSNNERSNPTVVASQSDDHFRYIANSNSSLSDIFVNNSCSGEINITETNNTLINPNQAQQQQQQQYANNKNNSTNQFGNGGNNPIYNSCGSIGGISITVPVATGGDSEYRDLDVLRRSLETCCQILQQQQQMPSASFNSEESPINVDMVKKYDGIRSYVTSTTCSAVSSLANIGSPSSPPQATSPTGEVKELLEQIRQLQIDNSILENTSTETQQQQPQQQQQEQPQLQQILSEQSSNIIAPPLSHSQRRPSSFQNKKKFFSKPPSKAMYIPINNTSVRSMKSPVGAATSFLARGRGRRGWISRSAPTTPGTTLPPSRLGDDSPLLNEHDEDTEQNA